MGMLTHNSLVEMEQKKKGAEKSVPEAINKVEKEETKSVDKQTKRRK